MSTTRTAWHLLLAVALGERGARGFDIRSEVPLLAEPLRPDFLFHRGENADDGSATTLKKLWRLIRTEAIVEFKSIAQGYRSRGLDKILAYVQVHFANNNKEQFADRGQLCGVLLVPRRTKSLNADARAYRLRWHDLGDGYWRLERGAFAIIVVELEIVAEVENDDVLRFLVRKDASTVEGRQWLARQFGSEEIRMKMHELEGYDDALQMLLRSLPPEKVLAAYAPEQRLAGLAPEQRLAGLAPEQRLAGLAPEQVVLGLPDNVLRALSDAFIDALPDATRAAIRKRIGK